MTETTASAKIVRFESLDSTNLKAKEMALGGASVGTVVVANSQTQGRGSGKRAWLSPPGGLYLSTLLYPARDRRPTDLSILAGVAMAQAVKELLPKASDVSVKWPNDCLVGWKKVGGVLCETLGEKYGNFCVVGMGLNINIECEQLVPFQANPFQATSFQVETGGRFEIEQALEMVVRKLFFLYHLYQQAGFEEIRTLWEKNCGMIGKRVELRETGWKDSEVEGKPVLGTFEGIDDQGGFVLSNARGERRQYITGEITCFWP